MNKAEEFDEIATNVFAPIYPVLAKQILKHTDVKTGVCLDLGSGGGHLGLALAGVTKCKVILYDINRDALDLAEQRIKERDMKERVKVVEGDVHRLPFPDESFNLIISRGSLWFWEDHATAFREIYRVLALGGAVYLGGGFGTQKLRDKIVKTMNKRENGGWEERIKGYRGRHTLESILTTLNSLDIAGSRVIDDDSGTWFCFGKPESFGLAPKNQL